MKLTSDQMQHKIATLLNASGQIIALDHTGPQNRPGNALQSWAFAAKPRNAQAEFQAAAKAKSAKPAQTTPQNLHVNKVMTILNSMP